MTKHLTGRPARQTAAAGLVLLLLLSSCGDDDDSSSAGRPDQRSPSAETSTTTIAVDTTQPSAVDEDAAFPLIGDLAIEANTLVDELLQDPTAVEDPDNEQIARLREIHTDDSPTPDGVVAQLEALVEGGQRERPAASGVFSDFGVYQMTALDDDTVRFRTCSSEDSETIDAEGNVVDHRSQVSQGVGEARRVNGAWRIYGIHLEDDRTIPLEPGTARPGFCDDLFAGQEP
jgi:hypothetical protein